MATTRTCDLTKRKQSQSYAKADIPSLHFDLTSLVFFWIFLYLAGDKEIRGNCCETAISMFNHMGHICIFALFLNYVILNWLFSLFFSLIKTHYRKTIQLWFCCLLEFYVQSKFFVSPSHIQFWEIFGYEIQLKSTNFTNHEVRKSIGVLFSHFLWIES